MKFKSVTTTIITCCVVLILASGIATSNTAVYQPPSVPVDSLGGHLPVIHQLALSRINEYRKAAGLPEWIYDPTLSRMAQAHADYVLCNCLAGRENLVSDHYERPDLPGYTWEGDQAARTSPISFRQRNALAALEALMSGPYHRLQFLNPLPMRVGVGSTYEPSSGCGATLFVTRPLETADKQSRKGLISLPSSGSVWQQ